MSGGPSFGTRWLVLMGMEAISFVSSAVASTVGQPVHAAVFLAMACYVKLSRLDVERRWDAEKETP